MPFFATSYDLPSSLFMLYGYCAPYYPGVIVTVAGVVMLAKKREGALFMIGVGIVALVMAIFTNQLSFRSESYMQGAYLRAWIEPFILSALIWSVARRTRDRTMLII